MSTLTVHLTITGADGAPKVPLTIEPSVTSTQLRQQAAEATKIPIESLKLIFRGRLISNNDTQLAVSEFKLEDGSVLHCMGKPAPAASSAEGGVSSQAATTNNNLASASAAQPASRLSFNAFPSASVSAPAPTADPLQAALATLRAGLSQADYLTAVQTLEKILSNIVTQPMEEKYRSLKKSNAAFQRKLGGKRGGDELMKAAGFIVEIREGVEYYALQASAEAWPKLVATHGILQAVVRQAQAISAAPAPPPVPPTIGSSSNMPFNFDQIPSDFMSNPVALQGMLQVR
jgi:ubiquilin